MRFLALCEKFISTTNIPNEWINFKPKWKLSNYKSGHVNDDAVHYHIYTAFLVIIGIEIVL